MPPAADIVLAQQAIELPLPDEACRARLLRLVVAKLPGVNADAPGFVRAA